MLDWRMDVAIVLALLAIQVDDGFLERVSRGSYELALEGELSGREIGAARFEADRKVDGFRCFVVQLMTPALEGGIFLVFEGAEAPAPGRRSVVPAGTKGMGSYKKLELDEGGVAVLYYEMERERMVLLGSTGKGSVEITSSDDGAVRGTIDVEVEGAVGNPSAFLGVRKKRGRLFGAFDATEGDIEFRKP